MAKTDRARDDAAVDAGRMLRRLGFAVLALAAPLLAMGSRRGLVIMVPVGIALLVLSRALETEGREPRTAVLRAVIRPAGLAAVFLLFWAGLSLAWTPFPREAGDRLLNLAGFGLLGLVAVASLPERMRGSNLNLLPIGVAMAGLVGLAISVSPWLRGIPLSEDRAQFLERGLLLVALMAPAAMTWLISKDRFVSSFLLVAVVTGTLLLGRVPGPVIALLAGGVVFICATLSPRLGRGLALIGMSGLLIAAPLVPFVMRPAAKLLFGPEHAKVGAIRAWGRIVTDDPARLITGRGFDTAARARAAGLVPPDTPSGILFEIWYDLGLLGAAATAILIALAIRGTARLHAGAAPGALMTLTVAFTLAVLGQATVQAWWLIGLSIAGVMVFAVDHGQYRTRRPRSRIVPPKARRIPVP